MKEVITGYKGSSSNPTPQATSRVGTNSTKSSQAQSLYNQILSLQQSLTAINQKSQSDVASAGNSVSKIKGYISSLNISAELLNTKLSSAQSALNYQITFANSHPPGFSAFTLNSNIQSAQDALANVQAAVQKFNQDISQLQNALNQCNSYYTQVVAYLNDVTTSVQSMNLIVQSAQRAAVQGLVDDVQNYLNQSQQFVNEAQQSEASALNLSGEADQLSYSSQSYYQDAQTQQQLG
jgi:prefoldin subunit 5